jgi:hypothetical protein
VIIVASHDRSVEKIPERVWIPDNKFCFAELLSAANQLAEAFGLPKSRELALG